MDVLGWPAEHVVSSPPVAPEPTLHRRLGAPDRMALATGDTDADECPKR
jgi:hypothetical protein